jgi:hypothetical protein
VRATYVEPLWRELLKSGLPSLLSVVLGVGSALYVTSHQAGLQRNQLILDRKITAIKEFAAVSWRGPAERTTRIIDLKSRVDGALERASDSIQLERLVADYLSLISLFAQWSSEQASQAVIATALMRADAPRYPNVEIKFLKWEQFRTSTPQQQHDNLERCETRLRFSARRTSSSIWRWQAYVSKVAVDWVKF